MSGVEKIDCSDNAAWDRFVLESSLGSIFHLSSWREIISKTFGGEPLYFVLKDDSGCIKAGIPCFFMKDIVAGRRLVSLPLASFCDPLVGSPGALYTLLDAILEHSAERSTSYIEMKAIKELKPLDEKNFKCYVHYNTHILPLDMDLSAIEKSFHTNVKRCLKKTKNGTVTVREAVNIEDVKAFFKLHVLTRRKHGLFPQPLGFFTNIWQMLCSKSLCSILLASHNHHTIGAAVFLKFKDTFYYEYGASDEKFEKLYPTHILLWEGIRMAHKEKFKFFDFGRSLVENEGLNIFKKKWGADPKNLYYYYYPDIKGTALAKARENRYSLIRKVNRYMPSAIMEILGNAFYRSFL